MPEQPWRNFLPTQFDNRRVIRAALAVLVLAVFSPGAFAEDAARGKIIAKRWCAACHVVAPDQTLASSDAPTFAAIARRHEGANKLRAFLADPHPKMPDMNLSRSEIADIVAYIGRLDR
jgi:mono/diheme cytochrome c family protein